MINIISTDENKELKQKLKNKYEEIKQYDGIADQYDDLVEYYQTTKIKLNNRNAWLEKEVRKMKDEKNELVKNHEETRKENGILEIQVWVLKKEKQKKEDETRRGKSRHKRRG